MSFMNSVCFVSDCRKAETGSRSLSSDVDTGTLNEEQLQSAFLTSAEEGGHGANRKM